MSGGGDDGGGKGHKGPSVGAPIAVVGPGSVFPLSGRGGDIAHGAEISAAMLSGGWAFHRWVSRNAGAATAQIGEGQDPA